MCLLCIKPEVSSPFSLNFRAIFHWFLISLMLIFVFGGFFLYYSCLSFSLPNFVSALILFYLFYLPPPPSSHLCSSSLSHSSSAPLLFGLLSQRSLTLTLLSLWCHFLWSVLSPYLSKITFTLSVPVLSNSFSAPLLTMHSFSLVCPLHSSLDDHFLSLWPILAFSPLLSSITSLCSFYFSPILSIPLSALIGPSLSLSLFVFFPVAI